MAAASTQDCKMDLDTTAFRVQTTYSCSVEKTDTKKGITKNECKPAGQTSIGLKGGIMGTQMLGGVPSLKPIKIEKPINESISCNEVEEKVKGFFP